MIITEGTYTDQAQSQAYAHQPGIVTQAQIQAWRTLVQSVHTAGASIFLQLMHAGALSQENHYRTHTLAPSAVLPKGEKMPEYGGQGPFSVPEAMSEKHILEAIEGFAQSAVNARDAGFDGVEVHGANGYLLDQFITNYTNRRTDRYGGSIKGRIRFAVEVVEAIRLAVGKEYPLGMRLSQTKVNDFVYRWPGGQKDGEVIFSALAEAGVSYLHLASEGRDWRKTASIADGVTITQLARKVAHIPVIANGGMHDPSLAEQIINEGHADMISLARGALVHADWPQRVAQGLALEAFDPEILHPRATIENALRWRTLRERH
ncbi:NADH:flavin oxidoreductase [Ktedonospora formicarum]|uniref:NADH:flavin oxidoreductase n=2 Tax=Ktedonospora formicarum TaxID=2778364 RepID=A0A8J3I2P4_9CHLR|nr:NADH:flavin oxidoreductase [Ktedonospora formicarum]